MWSWSDVISVRSMYSIKLEKNILLRTDVVSLAILLRHAGDTREIASVPYRDCTWYCVRNVQPKDT